VNKENELEKTKKNTIVADYAIHEGDTGSSHVQIALLTTRIMELTEHLKAHPHDHHCRRSLLKLIGQRRHFLAYLNKRDVSQYRTIIAKLGLRK
jgi:small subunit ribosomal protein S15